MGSSRCATAVVASGLRVKGRAMPEFGQNWLNTGRCHRDKLRGKTARGDARPTRDMRLSRAFFMGHISSHNSLQPPVFGAQQEGAILGERFGPAANFARTRADDNFFADCFAVL